MAKKQFDEPKLTRAQLREDMKRFREWEKEHGFPGLPLPKHRRGRRRKATQGDSEGGNEE
jgi:hypothetical protein